MNSLLNKCKIFYRLAQLKISVVDNKDPILTQLSNKPSFEQRIDFAQENFKKIGEGSSRIVFEISNENLLKLAKNEKGIAQNKLEMHPKMQSQCTNKILAADTNGKYIIVRFAEKITKNRFEKLTGFDFDEFMEALFYKFNNEADVEKPKKTYGNITKSELFECLSQLIFDCDLQIGDIMRINSWGEVDNKPVLIDYGLSRDLYEKFYAE